tara:strand:+ start:1024 stop:2256 length:1233 start_codon:yes stop_codon:yes gene_type:complete
MAAGTITLANISNSLKITYAKGMEKIAYKNHPLLGMIPKESEFEGKSYNQSIRNAAMQGRSATFTTAQAQVGTNEYNEFTITARKNYSIFRIEGQVIAMAKGAGAYVEQLSDAIDGAIQVITDDMSTNLYRGASGTRGRVAAFPAATTLQLATIEDVINFELGMEVGSSATDGTGAADVGTATITAIDRVNGILTTDGGGWVAQIPAILVNNFLFTSGDYNLKMQGLDSWVPTDRTGLAVAFNGVTRSVDPDRLAGMFFDGAGGPIETTLNNAVGLAFRMGCRTIDTCMMNPVDMGDLVNAISNRIREPRPTTRKAETVGKASIGYEGFAVTTPSGTIEVFSDPFCPKGTFRLLTLDTWKLKTAGKAPDFLMADDQKILRVAADDAYEGRVGYYGNVVCKNPGANMVVLR